MHASYTLSLDNNNTIVTWQVPIDITRMKKSLVSWLSLPICLVRCQSHRVVFCIEGRVEPLLFQRAVETIGIKSHKQQKQQKQQKRQKQQKQKQQKQQQQQEQHIEFSWYAPFQKIIKGYTDFPYPITDELYKDLHLILQQTGVSHMACIKSYVKSKTDIVCAILCITQAKVFWSYNRRNSKAMNTKQHEIFHIALD